MSVVRLAEAVGRGQGTDQPGAGRAGIRKLLSRVLNPRDNREVLVCLARTGLIAHDAMLAGAPERNQRLLEELGKEEAAVLLGHVGRLTDVAAKMLQAAKDLNCYEFSRPKFRRGMAGGVKIACLAPLVALR
jgi:hypothetical protein